MREVAPWGLVFVPMTGEAGGEKRGPGSGVVGSVSLSDCGQRGIAFSSGFAGSRVGDQSSRKEGPGPLLLCFPD